MEANMSATGSETQSFEGSESSSNSTQPSREEHIYDPVETHLIRLQEYYREVRSIPLVQKVLSMQESKAKRQDPQLLLSEKRTMPKDIPDYPEFVPLSENRPKTIHKLQHCLDKKELEEELNQFVERVFAMCGCVVSEDDQPFMTAVLGNITGEFLQQLVRYMQMVKDSENFSNSDGLWSPFETTLQQIGFGGVAGLYAFYEEKVIKEYAFLNSECLRLKNIVEALKDLLG